MDLVKVVLIKENFEWCELSWILGLGFKMLEVVDEKFYVVVYDFGVKCNILCMLVDCGCKLIVVFV